MKRLLDADKPGPSARNPVDVDITRILPDNLKQIASASLDVLLGIATTQHPWLEEIQKDQGRLIVTHHEWHPIMRPIVQQAFASAHMDELLFLVPTDDADTGVPWTLLMPHWMRWNAWLYAYPAQDESEARTAEWTVSFQFLTYHLLDGNWTRRRRALVSLLLKQGLMLLEYYPKTGSFNGEHAFALSMDFMTVLEYALRVRWRQHKDAASASFLITHVTTTDVWTAVHFLGFDGHRKRAPATIRSLDDLVPRFFVDTRACTPDVATRIYPLVRGQKPSDFFEFLQDATCINAYIRIAKDTPPTPDICARLGQAAVVDIKETLWTPGNVEEFVNDCYINPLVASRAFTGPWVKYWDLVSPVISELLYPDDG